MRSLLTAAAYTITFVGVPVVMAMVALSVRDEFRRTRQNKRKEAHFPLDFLQ